MAARGKNIVYRRLIRSYITSVISISLVLVLVAAAAVLAANAGGVARWFKENMSVTVMLKQSATEKEGRALAEELSTRPYVKESRFITKEEGAAEMKELLGEDFLSVFESSPIPLSIDLKLDGDAITTDSLGVIKASLLAHPRVDEVVYQETLVETLNSNLRRIGLVLGVVILLLLIISFALINNTVRLNIYARRFTIHTMRLVGAKNSFISRPFVKQALLQGAVSGVLADLILLAALLYIRSSSQLLYSLFDKGLVAGVMVALVVLGMLICSLSALLVTRKISYSSKDDLYY